MTECAARMQTDRNNLTEGYSDGYKAASAVAAVIVMVRTPGFCCFPSRSQSDCRVGSDRLNLPNTPGLIVRGRPCAYEMYARDSERKGAPPSSRKHGKKGGAPLRSESCGRMACMIGHACGMNEMRALHTHSHSTTATTTHSTLPFTLAHPTHLSAERAPPTPWPHSSHHHPPPTTRTTPHPPQHQH